MDKENKADQLGQILLRDKIILLGNAIDSINDCVCITDLNENIIFVNESFMKTYGYKREELLGESIKELRSDHYQADTTEKIVPEIMKGGWEGEVWNRRKDGTEFLIWLSASVIRDAADTPIAYMSVARDITKQKKAEEELKNALSLLSATIEATADGILVVDTQRNVVAFNKKFVEMWKIPESILTSKDAERLLEFEAGKVKNPKGFIDKVRELYARPSAESDDLIELKNGRIFERYSCPQRVGGKNIGRVWSFHDITKLKKAEEALRKLRKKKKK